jgi:hypothetical protein
MRWLISYLQVCYEAMHTQNAADIMFSVCKTNHYVLNVIETLTGPVYTTCYVSCVICFCNLITDVKIA